MKNNVVINGLFIVSMVLFNSCENKQQMEDIPTDVRWVRNSVEYQALCSQIYRMAWQTVKERAATLSTDWVVVLDVDETVLDNSRYQEIIYEQHKDYPYYWDDWCLRAECPAVPGSKAFIDSLRSLGKRAHIAYITNRKIKLHQATQKNLETAGLWEKGDVLLCRDKKPDNKDTKETRRSEVLDGTGRCQGMGKRVIIALFGDQLNDFTSYPKLVSKEEYKKRYSSSEKWGAEYFVLPNPMYGYWDRGYK